MPSSPAAAVDDRAQQEFRRDGPTAVAYAGITLFAFWNYAYGPALALLRDELRFSYTLLGAYTAAWSAGAVLTGLGFPAVARRVSRVALLRSSALLATAGAALFGLGHTVGLTLAGAVVLGLGGTLLLTVLQAVLSDRHGARRDRALTEANIGAAACAVLAPLALGVLATGPVGWRAAFALPALGLAVLCLRHRRERLPAAALHQEPRASGRLPLACWSFVGLAAASMGVEFCLVYFGAEQLRATGLSTAAAVTAMSCHYLGLVLGRVGGAVVARRPGQDAAVLYASLAVTAVGFLLFWLSGQPAPAVLGLLLAGLGIANLYPLSVALSLGAAPGQEDQANSRTQLVGGALVVVAPYLLGSLADRFGLTAAFAVEPVLIGLCLLLLPAGLRALRAHAASGAAASRVRTSAAR